ncbi:MAG: hypothetical protein ACT4PE_05660 [Candidatus Eiseniibacteriota bacterium]
MSHELNDEQWSDTCAFCGGLLTQSMVRLPSGEAYHIDPCRVLVLEAELAALRKLDEARAERDRLREALEGVVRHIEQGGDVEGNCYRLARAALAGVKGSGENDAASGGEVASGVCTRGQDVSGNRDAAVAPEGNASPTQAATPYSLTLTRYYALGGLIYDRMWGSPGYIVKVWARRNDECGLTDIGPEVGAEAERLTAKLNSLTLTRDELRALAVSLVWAGIKADSWPGMSEPPPAIAARVLADWEAKR